MQRIHIHTVGACRVFCLPLCSMPQQQPPIVRLPASPFFKSILPVLKPHVVIHGQKINGAHFFCLWVECALALALVLHETEHWCE